MMIFKGKRNHYAVQQTNSEALLISALLQQKTLLLACCMPIYACQLWSKYTQTSMKRLPAAYNKCLPNYASHTQKCKCSPTPGQPLCQDI